DEIVGRGCYARFGAEHAEVVALREAGERAAGATVYVTLEPCCHWGRRPPCVDALVAAQVARVCYAMRDPDPAVDGGGIAALQEAGIETIEGALEAQAQRLNEAYIRHRTTGRPFVTLKMALTADGKTATRTGESQWITGKAARGRVHELRHAADAVLVGVGTILADDPMLTCRLPDGGIDPVAVVADSKARTPATARVVQRRSPAATIIATTSAASVQTLDALGNAGAEILLCADRDGRVDLGDLLGKLAEIGRINIMCEGGATLAAALVEGGHVQKICFFVAPKLLGGAGAPTALGGDGAEHLAEAIGLGDVRVEQIGSDVLYEGYVCSPE
ncbi:MAG: bifunctional diaminohydroxyphosphoribosylaminopyrimidine deaminase/5-amino-6-(5-phosphoribosylamino)uracil reductase RibD, partial [Armatimonadota bacterium]